MQRWKNFSLTCISKCRAEDNDDIVEIIDIDSPEMKQEHGDFFIAELLLGTSGNSIENDKVVVTEVRSAP